MEEGHIARPQDPDKRLRGQDGCHPIGQGQGRQIAPGRKGVKCAGMDKASAAFPIFDEGPVRQIAYLCLEPPLCLAVVRQTRIVQYPVPLASMPDLRQARVCPCCPEPVIVDTAALGAGPLSSERPLVPLLGQVHRRSALPLGRCWLGSTYEIQMSRFSEHPSAFVPRRSGGFELTAQEQATIFAAR